MSYIEIENHEELTFEIEQTIRKYFPHSFLRVSYTTKLMPVITIWFAVGRENEKINGIIHNDISYTIIHIHSNNGRLELEPTLGGSIRVNATPHTLKVGLRRKKGNKLQMVKHIDTYFKKLLLTLKNNRDIVAHSELLDSIGL